MTLLAITPDVYQNIADWAVLITVALIGLIGVLLGLILRGQHRNAQTGRQTLHQVKTFSATGQQTLNQVQNSHETNLRDDLDEKFAGLAGLVKGAVDDIGEIRTEVGTLRQDVGGIKADIRQIHTDQTADRSIAGAAARAAALAADTAQRALERTRPGVLKPNPRKRPTKGTP